MKNLFFAQLPLFIRKEKRIETKIYKESGISYSYVHRLLYRRV